MVNYQDPVTIETDFSTYAFLSLTVRLHRFSGLPVPVRSDLLVRLFNSGAREILARSAWHIYVSLPVLPR